MAVRKRTRPSGTPEWYYCFDLPGSTRQSRNRISGWGFSTKREAEEAEARRRIEEQRKQDLATGASVAAPLPKTLSMLLEEFFRQHVDEKLTPKIIERYHDQALYLDPELLRMPIAEMTSLHLTREWHRLLKRGGYHRRTKQPRPLSAKTVRNIAGVVSSAFARAIRWGLISTNQQPTASPLV